MGAHVTGVTPVLTSFISPSRDLYRFTKKFIPHLVTTWTLLASFTQVFELGLALIWLIV